MDTRIFDKCLSSSAQVIGKHQEIKAFNFNALHLYMIENMVWVEKTAIINGVCFATNSGLLYNRALNANPLATSSGITRDYYCKHHHAIWCSTLI